MGEAGSGDCTHRDRDLRRRELEGPDLSRNADSLYRTALLTILVDAPTLHDSYDSLTDTSFTCSSCALPGLLQSSETSVPASASETHLVHSVNLVKHF